MDVDPIGADVELRRTLAPHPLVLTADQVATACQVCTTTVYRAVAARRLRAVRLGRGGAYRFRLDDVGAWIEGSTVEPMPRSTLDESSRTKASRRPPRRPPPVVAPAPAGGSAKRGASAAAARGRGPRGRHWTLGMTHRKPPDARPGIEVRPRRARDGTEFWVYRVRWLSPDGTKRAATFDSESDALDFQARLRLLPRGGELASLDTGRETL